MTVAMTRPGSRLRTLWRLEPGLWLFVRLVLGVEWVRAGWEKVGAEGWTDPPRGAAVAGFLRGAIAKSTEGEHPEVPAWYARLAEDVFLPNASLFGPLVAYGELLVGIALLLGLLTRLAALGGVSMNLAFLWAGTTSTNPPMMLLGLALALLAHRGGRFGVDGWLMPWLSLRIPVPLQRLGNEALFVLGVIVVAGLALATTDVGTWVVALLVAVVIALAATARGRAR